MSPLEDEYQLGHPMERIGVLLGRMRTIVADSGIPCPARPDVLASATCPVDTDDTGVDRAEASSPKADPIREHQAGQGSPCRRGPLINETSGTPLAAARADLQGMDYVFGEQFGCLRKPSRRAIHRNLSLRQLRQPAV